MNTKYSHIFLFIFVLFAFQIACGQNQSVPDNNNQKTASEKTDWKIDNLKKQASELYAAFDKNDFDKFVELTYPKVIEKVGGRENLISMMKNISDQNPKIFQSFSSSVDNPSQLVEIDNQLFGVVPIKLEGTTYKNNKIVTLGSVIGISTDNGKTWKFVNGSKFKELFPNAADKVQIPKDMTLGNGKEQ